MGRFVKESFTYQGQESLPDYWKRYFSMSQIGNQYEVIKDLEPLVYASSKGCKGCESIHDLIMSNTEYEYATNQPFFDLCLQYERPKVLSIGYGIGLIIPEMERQNVYLTIIEKYNEILQLDENINVVSSNHTIINDDINTIDFSTLGNFDLVFVDIGEPLTRANTELESLLNPGGQIYYWKHLNE